MHGERGDRRDAVAIVRREGFQVGGNTGAAGRIESRDGEKDGRRLIGVIVQLLVPSALGTNAGNAVYGCGVPAKENVRALPLRAQLANFLRKRIGMV